MVRACPELAASLGRGVRNAVAQTSLGLLETRAPREKRALPTQKPRRGFACSTQGVGAPFSSLLVSSRRLKKHSSDRFRQVGGSGRRCPPVPLKVVNAGELGETREPGRRAGPNEPTPTREAGRRGARLQLPTSQSRRRVPGVRRRGRGRPPLARGAHSPAALCARAPGRDGSCSRRSRQRASAARLSIRAAAGGSAPTRGRGVRDWGGRQGCEDPALPAVRAARSAPRLARHGRARHGWAPGAEPAPVRSGARRGAN